ncbi:hypothetical protein PR202_ga10592 [Eleusine coracana subsp. coracana]|uniref:Leucine-rich repeat-containing N-terminal plant-type domain-containing protein n=1 Tax=Eleusine coracana subsp. coracana TaxID=191504 RepID=A0AAV5C793_ELECO|nr:hypothetical protein PR202_ga10592 [Eleusine coracana subsp. coracana]
MASKEKPERTTHSSSSSILLHGCCSSLLPPAYLAITTSSSVYAQQTSVGCIPKERNALLSFRAGITSDPQNLLASWNGQDCCQWIGVKCSNSTGHVIKVDLRNKFFLDDLYGPSMDTYYLHRMRGKISSSLLALRHLKYLDLSGNHLGGVGVSMPRFLGSLRSLTYLNLSSTDFNGPVPPQLGNLSRLQYLDIDNIWNDNDNKMHSKDISWLARLRSLRFLDMSGVSLRTIGNWVQVVNMLSNLRVLRLRECQLVFPYASIARPNLTSLEKVDLKDNRYTLNPAYWFWHAGTIKHLDLTNNMIVGTLPDAVGITYFGLPKRSDTYKALHIEDKRRVVLGRERDKKWLSNSNRNLLKL